MGAPAAWLAAALAIPFAAAAQGWMPQRHVEFIAPKGITPAQIAYWEEVMRKVATSEEFRASAERAQGEALYRNAADTRKHMEAEYEQARSVMAYLGFFKP